IQAGAGIIAQSTPERELTETREKLASIAPYLMVGPVGFPGRRSPRRAGRSGIPHTHPPTERAG
ncbi:hypothetical protein CQA77_25250, partial [Klebsiella pneumoniae]